MVRALRIDALGSELHHIDEEGVVRFVPECIEAAQGILHQRVTELHHETVVDQLDDTIHGRVGRVDLVVLGRAMIAQAVEHASDISGAETGGGVGRKADLHGVVGF